MERALQHSRAGHQYYRFENKFWENYPKYVTTREKRWQNSYGPIQYWTVDGAFEEGHPTMSKQKMMCGNENVKNCEQLVGVCTPWKLSSWWWCHCCWPWMQCWFSMVHPDLLLDSRAWCNQVWCMLLLASWSWSTSRAWCVYSTGHLHQWL